MISGLMQPAQLQISNILRYAQQAHGSREIVARQIEEPLWRYDYARFAARVERAAKALMRLGVRPGDRVTSLAWNTHRHLELFYAVRGRAGTRLTAFELVPQFGLEIQLRHRMLDRDPTAGASPSCSSMTSSI